MTEQQAQANRIKRDKRDGMRFATHEAGLCGPMASLCSECAEDEIAWMQAWAEKQPNPEPGESPEAYWRRIGGRFLDSWYTVAVRRMKSGE